MKTIITGLLLALSASASAELLPIEPQHLQIEDADTLQVEIDGSPQHIQLMGIDAPEAVMNPKLQRDTARIGLTQDQLLPLGHAANEGLSRLLKEFEPYRLKADLGVKDKYGRVPGDLHGAAGLHLSTRLVEEGYALPLPTLQGERAELLKAAAELARSERRGLWGSHLDTFSAWANGYMP